MNKKALFGTTCAVSLCLTVGVLFFNSNSSFLEAAVHATNNVVWYHYAAVEPTENRHGSKEFWASNENGCSTHTFIDPGVSCIERDFSTMSYFDDLDENDDRYIAPLDSGVILTFEQLLNEFDNKPEAFYTDVDLIVLVNGNETTFHDTSENNFETANGYVLITQKSDIQELAEDEVGEYIIKKTDFGFTVDGKRGNQEVLLEIDSFFYVNRRTIFNNGEAYVQVSATWYAPVLNHTFEYVDMVLSEEMQSYYDVLNSQYEDSTLSFDSLGWSIHVSTMGQTGNGTYVQTSNTLVAHQDREQTYDDGSDPIMPPDPIPSYVINGTIQNNKLIWDWESQGVELIFKFVS